MEQKDIDALAETVGKQATAKIQSEMAKVEAKAKEVAEQAIKNNGLVTEEAFKSYQDAAKAALKVVEDIAKSQGTTLGELTEKLAGNSGKDGRKSIADVLRADEAELKSIFQNRTGVKEYLLQQNSEGGFTMRAFDRHKAAGPTATVGGIGGGGNVASITQNLLASTLLRVGGDAQIVSAYRNTPWIFDLIDVTTAEFVNGAPYAMWFEETAKQGSAAVVAEGGTKPLVQYSYVLRSAEYKKVAQLIQFTEEFSIDFRRLQDEIMGKGRVDLLNTVNAAILANIISAATAYNTGAQFMGDEAVPFVNDFDAIAAMAAQVDNATFGNLANTAIMSTFKKYRMGISKSEEGQYLNRPDVISNISFVGNPSVGANDVVVGDLRQYHMIMRGGLIVKVGYNGTDFAENKFSVVMEQYYFDWISDIRKSAIVKGPTFAAVKDAIDGPVVSA